MKFVLVPCSVRVMVDVSGTDGKPATDISPEAWERLGTMEFVDLRRGGRSGFEIVIADVDDFDASLKDCMDKSIAALGDGL